MNMLRKIERIPILAISIITGLIVSMAVIWIRSKGTLETLELSAYDYFMRLQAEKPEPLSDRIVLLTITEEDIHSLGHWPISDQALADLIRILLKAPPRAIGLDIYRDIPVPPGTENLRELFTGPGSRTVIAVKKVGDDNSSSIPGPFMISDNSQIGFNDIIIDKGGIIRRGLLFIDDGETVSFSFPLLLALQYLSKEGIVPQPDPQNTQFIRLGSTTFIPFESDDGGYVKADARGYQFLVSFGSKKKIFKAYHLSEVLSGSIPSEAFRDKIVIVGVTAESLKDFFFTPLSQGMDVDQKMQGIELHARIALQLLKAALKGEAPMKTVSEGYEWLWIAAWGLTGGILGIVGRSPLRVFMIFGISLSILAGSTYLLSASGIWIPFVPPAFSWSAAAILVTAFQIQREKTDKTELMDLFSRHVSKDVAKKIWLQRDNFMDGGRPRPQKLTATVLFADLEGFTTHSEELQPQVLMEWLNEYMEVMTGVIIKNGGIINKYIGDAIMALFGVPVARSTEEEIRTDACNAVRCALDMEKELETLNKNWEKRNLPTTRMRIGIYTGPLIAGSIGGAQRTEYTVIGDTVNIASRLESYQKDFWEKTGAEAVTCRILIGDETARHISGVFTITRIGETALKGRTAPVTIYTVTKGQGSH